MTHACSLPVSIGVAGRLRALFAPAPCNPGCGCASPEAVDRDLVLAVGLASMVVQFLCPACSQPLEIDDQWAGKPVSCPYCCRTVTTPSESTLDQSAIPQATGLLEADGLTSPAAEQMAPPEIPTTSHPLAGWSLALGAAAVAVFIGMNIVLGMDPEVQRTIGGAQTTREVQERMMEQMASGNMPSWFLTTVIGGLLIFGLWLAGLVCGFIALSKPGPRRKAHLGLLLCGGLLLVSCLSTISPLIG